MAGSGEGRYLAKQGWWVEPRLCAAITSLLQNHDFNRTGARYEVSDGHLFNHLSRMLELELIKYSGDTLMPREDVDLHDALEAYKVLLKESIEAFLKDPQP